MAKKTPEPDIVLLAFQLVAERGWRHLSLTELARRADIPLAQAKFRKNLIEGRTGKWEVVLGLEVHAQVTSHSKLFSGAATDFGAEPNTQVSLVDAGFPGMLPVINQVCVEQAVKTGLGLNAQINLKSVFDRKNYFYADLPNGYQISQFLQPIVGKGTILLGLHLSLRSRSSAPNPTPMASVAESSVSLTGFVAGLFSGSRILTPSAASCFFQSSNRCARSRMLVMVA